MCGIAGFFGSFPESLLSQMVEKLNHRGPDAKGELFLPLGKCAVGLVHRRLSILDLSSLGNQPMRYGLSSLEKPEEDVWITYNGEIYNFPELRRELESQGHRFRSQTDTEVILHLYVEQGVRAFEKLNGIFSFALYDGRTRGQKDGVHSGDLLIYRDGLGVKPLYYSETEQGVIFASEMKSLLSSEAVGRDLDPAALRYLMSYLYCPAPHSPLSAIKKLEPGQSLWVREGRVVEKKYYYDIPYGGILSTESEKGISEKLRHHLEAAAKRQLIADVPVGAFLSGGVDSTAVVALMKRAAPDRLFPCFTIDDTSDDRRIHDSNSPQVEKMGSGDLHYAERVAQQLGVPLTKVKVTPSDFSIFQEMLFHLDEPQADPAALNTLLIAKKARELGIKVLLSGAGGDDIFSGYGRHHAVYLEKGWSGIPGPFKQWLAKSAHRWGGDEPTSGATLMREGTWRKISKVLQSLQWDQESRLTSYFMANFPGVIEPLLGERLLERGERDSEFTPFLKSLSRIASEKNVLNRMLYLETKHFLADHNLNYVDKMSMSQGVEVRVPLIDLEVVNFAATIPPSLKSKRFENKYIFKQALKGLVPSEVLHRKKQGFGLPIRSWLDQHLGQLVDEALSEPTLRSRGLFNPKTVRELVMLHRKKEVDATFLIFSMVSIEMWCREFRC